MKHVKCTALIMVLAIALSIVGCGKTNDRTAYEQAVSLGYSGTQEEFLAALAGEVATNADGGRNESAYEIAVGKGYTGTLEQWLQSLGIDTEAISTDMSQLP